MRSIKFLTCVVGLLLCATARSAQAGTRTLVWDPNSEADIAGYIVYYGTQSGAYTGSVNVGNQTSWQFTIPDMTTFYLAVKAYNTAGLQSPPSAEVNVLLEPSMSVTLLAPTNGAAGIPVAISLAVRFSRAANALTINNLTFELRDAANLPVAAVISYDPVSFTAILDPVQPLMRGSTYSAIIRGGTVGPTVTDLVGDPLAGSYAWSFATVAATPTPSERGDFNGDGKPDLIWQHQTGGWLAAWFMDGTTAVGGSMFTPNGTDGNWEILGTGDFSGDGKPDLVWRYRPTGAMAVWVMNGTTAVGTAFLSANMSDPDWSVRTIADFNNDGRVDLVWQHQTTSRLAVWLMQGTTLLESVSVSTAGLSDTNWQVVGSGDFNQDGWTDLLWQHNTVPSASVWFMQGTRQIGGAGISTAGIGDMNWRIRALVDLNLDGNQDFIWQHATLGSVAAWLMNGTSVTDGGFLTPKAAGDLSWKVVAPH